tara:strand:+ start:149 stop:535 length:387 start_codon:yes stop_codon:yes gene_type:complete
MKKIINSSVSIFVIGSPQYAIKIADKCEQENALIISLSNNPPTPSIHKGVWFTHKEILTPHFLCASIHPWLVLIDEDNPNELIKHIAPYMVKGDTMIIGSTKGIEVPDILEGIQTPEGLELRKKRITL